MDPINLSTLRHQLANIDNITLTRVQAEAVFRFLMAMGAQKGVEMYHDSQTGNVSVKKPFKYPMSVICEKTGKLVDGYEEGQQYYTLGNFLKTLIRFDRAAHKRMRNVESKIRAMHAGIDALGKQL